MKILTHLQTRIFDTPVAIHPPKLEVILQALAPRMGLPWTAENAAELSILAGTHTPDSDPKSYYVTDEGIACLPIQGSLMKKSSGLMAMSGIASYEKISAQFEQALADPNVAGILFDIDSPGGETHGMFELCDLIYSARATKPIYGSINDHALSAAYALGSSVSKLFITQTGAAGSIGVFALHVDQSSADSKAGLKYSYIHAGKKKVEGNAHAPLSSSARADTQTEIDREYVMFCQAVARNRSLDYDAIEDTEAGVYFAETAIDMGLADEIGTFDDALSAITEAATGIMAEERERTLKGASLKASLKGTATSMPAIPPHKTAVDRGSWDGPAAKKNLSEDKGPSYYNRAFAYRDDSMDTSTKSAYSYIHHRVSGVGDIGSASLVAARTGIGILNGGRGGGGRQAYTSAERSGIYRHLAKHVSDAGEKPSPLKSYQDYLESLSAFAAELEQKGEHMASQKLLDDLEFVATSADYMKKGKKAKEEDGEEKEPKGAKGAKEEEDEDEGDEKDDKKAASPDEEDDKEDEPEPKKKGKKADDMKKAKKSKKAQALATLATAAAFLAKEDEEDNTDNEENDEDEDEDDEPKKKKGKSAEAIQLHAIEIVQACNLAGLDKLAVGFIAKGYSVARVQQILVNKRAEAANSSDQLNSAFGSATNTGNSSGGSVLALIEQKAMAIVRASGGKIKRPEAYNQVLMSEPALYERYEEERDDATHSKRTRREYVGSVGSEMRRMGLGQAPSGITDNLPPGRQ